MGNEITIPKLVRNGTMSAEMAGALWAAVDEKISFLTCAIPRNAGKSTVSKVILDLRPSDVPIHDISGEPEIIKKLKRDHLGGYLTLITSVKIK